jgi:hypothetical protein
LLVAGALVVSACSVSRATGDSLPPLYSGVTVPETTPIPPVKPDRTHDQWYSRHHDAILAYVDDIRRLRDQLAQVPDDHARMDICASAVNMEQPAYTRAYEAVDAHPDWMKAVELSRWMVATCSSGNAGAVGEILPQLEETLLRTDTWLSAVPSDAD